MEAFTHAWVTGDQVGGYTTAEDTVTEIFELFIIGGTKSETIIGLRSNWQGLSGL
jgi:hypothetical protein